MVLSLILKLRAIPNNSIQTFSNKQQNPDNLLHDTLRRTLWLLQQEKKIIEVRM